jgi:hypothetical protein
MSEHELSLYVRCAIAALLILGVLWAWRGDHEL